MKIIEDDPKDSKIILKINTIDDLWYLKNILDHDDQIITSVFRRQEQNADLNRSKSTERKKITVKLRIEKVDFLPYTDNLKILGEIIEGENSGSHQSVMVSVDDEITIIKNLGSEERNLLHEAVENYYNNNIVFVSLDDESCTIALLKSYGLQEMADISSRKSGKDYGSTSYSYSAGGPILIPSLKAMVISYIAPFGSRLRPIVCPDNTKITIKIIGKFSSLAIIDGQKEAVVSENDRIDIRVSDEKLTFIELKNSFYDRLREKLIKDVVN